ENSVEREKSSAVRGAVRSSSPGEPSYRRQEPARRSQALPALQGVLGRLSPARGVPRPSPRPGPRHRAAVEGRGDRGGRGAGAARGAGGGGGAEVDPRPPTPGGRS